MKKAFKRISKSSISLALSIVMIASSVLFTSASSADYKNDAASSVEQSTEVELYKGEGTIELEDGVSAEDFYEGKDTLNASASEEVDNAAEEISNEAAKSTSNEDEVSVKNDTAAVVATQKPQKVLPQASGTGSTISFIPPSSWTGTIKCYAYGGTADSWSGVPMTQNGSEYQRDVGDNTNVIFINYDNKVTKRYPADGQPGLTVVDGMTYDMSDSGTVTIYFKNPWGSNVTPYAYVYGTASDNGTVDTSANAQKKTNWPGDAMTLVENSVWKLENIPTKFKRVIFNTGNGGIQTGNFEIYNNGYYKHEGSDIGFTGNMYTESSSTYDYKHNLVYAISDKSAGNFHAAPTKGADATGTYFESRSITMFGMIFTQLNLQEIRLLHLRSTMLQPSRNKLLTHKHTIMMTSLL